MKVLVTGGAGFIGSHTVDALLSKGCNVRILDNFAKPVHLKGRPDYIPKEVEVIEGDVRNKEDWTAALDGIDVVYHFAAYQDYLPDFSTFFYTNAVGTALLYEVIVEKCLSIKKVIVASSQAVYGEGKYLCLECISKHWPNIRSIDQLRKGIWNYQCPECDKILEPYSIDESTVNPQNQYAISKYAQELIALNLGKRYSIPTVALRYSIVQGPRQSFYNAYSGVCRIFCLSYFFGKAPPIYEDGKQIRDFVNIEDVVRANLLVLEKDEADFDVFNVGSGRSYTVLEFANIVKETLKNNLEPKITGEYRYGDTRHIISDTRKLEKLGWKVKFTPQKSVEDYLGWLREQKDVDNVLNHTEKTMKDLNVVREIGA